MMKKILKIYTLGALLVSTSILANTQSNCDNLIGCKKKSCHIEQNIAVAKKMENEDKTKGLQISLEKVNKFCTDEKLREDLKDKIRDTEKDLKEDKEDYEKALEDNRHDKIEKYKDKISEENNKIERLKQELKELK